MRENLLKKQPTWGLRRAQGTGQKSATPATLTKVILVLLTMFLLPSAAWGQITVAGNSPNQSGNITGTGIKGTVTYSNGTLTLTGAEITGDIVWNPSENTDLTINLSGNNTLTGTISTDKNISSTVETNLSFTGSTDCSLEITKESESVISGNFKAVNFGNFNLATSSPGAYWDENRMADYSGSGVSNLKITSEVYYPIWVMHRTPEHTQLTSEVTQVDMVKKIDNTDVVICTVSYDATNGKLTIKANEEAENNGYAFQPGGSNAAIVVGPSMEELKAHLKGKTKITDYGSFVFSIWDTTSLIFTTDETSPGSLTGTKIVDWKSKNSGGTGQISCGNGLVYNAETNPQTISTTGVRLKIGNKEISASENITIADGTASFDATNNTLTLTGATIGGATSVSDIIVLVDEFNLKISGTCTINGSITYSGSNIQTSSIQISNTDAASLTVAGISGFGNCSMSEGLYLSAVNGAGIPTDIHYEPYKTEEGEAGCMRSNYGEFSTISFSTTKPSESIWIGNTQVGGDGSFSGIEGVSFKSENNINILTLNNANLPSNIISSLPNLTINLTGEDGQNKGRSSLSENSHIISTNPSATLTFTTDGDNSLWETIDNSKIPWIGFAGNPTFENKLVFLQAAGTMSIQVLHAPTMSYSSGSSGGLTFGGLSDSYNNTFDCYYTITYEDGDGSIINPTKYERGEVENQPNPVSMAEKPCTVTAYVTYTDVFDNTTQSEPAIGKYFGIADKTIVFNDKTKGTEMTVNDTELTENNLEIIPATEGKGVSFSPKFANNQDVISFIGETEPKFSIAGIGICEVGVKIDVENPTIQVLNPVPVEGDITAKGIVTVVPDEPKITITKKDTERDYYLNTDEIAITRAIVEGENTDNIKIFYTWAETDPKIGSDYTHDTANPTLTIYDNTKPIPAQTGTLWTWVGYQLAVNEYLMSKVASQALTVKTDISDYTVQGLATSATYTGAAIVPAFSVKASADAETSLTLNTDYTVSYQSVIIAAGDVGSGPSINYTDVDEMVEVGAYRIVITGTGDSYGGTKYADFAITKADLDIVTIESIADQTYTGSAITLEGVTVTLNGNTISPDEYEITGYTNNTNVTTETQKATVTIAATATSEHFTENTTKTAEFNIIPKELTEEMVTVSTDPDPLIYNGEDQTPNVTVTIKDGETTLEEGEDKDYTISYKIDDQIAEETVDAGTYTIVITGQGNYTGEVNTKTFTIAAMDASAATITLEADKTYTYNGSDQTPAVVSVELDGGTIPDTNYDISYSNNKNAGLATAGENAPTVIVTFKNNYSGEATTTFTIEQADLSDYVVTGLTTPTAYTGSPITPTFSVKATETAETSLTANTDYSVKYQQAGADVDEMKDAGDYKILITGEGNYKGSLDADFTIDRAQLNLTINLEGWAYGDTPNEPSLEGNLGEGDITWEYKAAGAEAYSAWSALTATTDAGTYMVRATVAETDNYYGGSKEAEFVIAQYDLANATVTLDPEELVYNGEVQTVNVTKVMAGDIEVDPSYYEISGNTGKEAKTYSLTVRAKTEDSSGNPIKNNFTGSAEKAWKINHRTASAEDLGFKSETQTASTYYNSDEDFNLPEGYVAYIITGINGNSVTTQRVSYIPKGVAVLVEKGQSSESPNDATPYPSTLPLKGTQEPVDVTSITGGTVYVLYNGEFVKSTSGTIPAHRCYLLIPDQIASGTRSFGIDHGDGTTSLREVKGEKWADGEWYTLQGQRIAKPAKGLYILNGKKVVIK